MFFKKTKVPVVMQMEALECGAACLAMIIAYHGKWIPLEKVRADCAVSRDGSNLRDMVNAANAYGLETEAYKCGLEDIKTLPLPAIIHWNFNHFVVLNAFKRDKAIINDPARGTVTVSMDEFDKAFTGVILCLEKGKNFKKGGKPKSVISFAKTRLRGTLVPFVFVVLTGLLITATDIINPGLSRVFMDRILIKPGATTAENPEWLYAIIFMMATLVVFQLIVRSIKEIYMLKIRGKLAIVANSMFMWHVLRLPMEFFSQRNIGDIAERQGSNEGIAETLIQSFAPILLDIVMLVFYLLVIIKISLLLTIIGVSSSLLNIFIGRYISNKRVNISRAQMRDAGKLASTTISGIEMIETIKASGAENGFFERWSGYQASVNSSRVKGEKLNQYLGTVPSILGGLSDIGVLMVGTMLIMSGYFTIGLLTQFKSLLGMFIGPIDRLRGTGQQVQEMRTLMERIEDVMNYSPDVDYKDEGEIIDSEKVYTKLSGKLEMKDVTFGYKKLSEPLIENFNLSLKPGSKVAFIGASGCGKSTLANLISGLYEPWSGQILFDDKPINNIQREIFTGSLAVVNQDITVFEDTICDNIKMWDNSIEDFEMILAARDAQIHEDIVRRPGGYEHRLLEGGKDFSGGQRQRLEIARTLAQDPTIIILDEATSALDAKTEYEVIKSITDRGITCIIIAHRLSTVRDCDEIIVLDKGKVIERGTHDELYSKNGRYAQLIATE
ncbi:MAG: Lactococcin-G-processing and transport ATP-binding protein LagD [Eubacteriales bacterium SKADARSKE-1]|nr:Lactococcin-G-processing and transport ATP-binding protein LagD [Eubacteriales bacterium SKADARSKE-1]